ncbi:MAG: tRNA (adenosine(37)-N6)-dimethylallyltransferase MiaA [Acidobacteriaceae bacterium]|nr:tRNA (adenosine(37)-N6)-dimethylallyltransferase MiaA [Acidobacteriaceae bacterium]
MSTPILVVLGPTGSGKSELGLCLASRFGGEIVNCDSIQVYKGLDIGSAKTPVQQRRGIPHHLLDVIGPGEELSAGSYSRRARDVISDIARRGRLPIVIGGTGFYLRALLDGLSPAPERDARLRRRLQQMAGRRTGVLHRVLRRYDPTAATRIHTNDTPKLIRAIEITLLSGEPATQAQAAARDAFGGIRVLKLGLRPERALLHSRLNARTVWLFKNGLIEEAKRLLETGYGSDSKPMQSLGYKQAVQYLAGQLSLERAMTECQAETRQYAKRQITWFRAERDVQWFPGFGSDKDTQEQSETKARIFLGA